MRLARLAGAALSALCLSAAAFAQGLAPPPDPQAAGFSAARLARIAPWYQAQIDAGAVTGAVVAIARDGRLAWLQAIGTQDRDGKVPMKPDSIFWIASMTKPVTSVAAMMLVEEGKLDLAAPLETYLPEFKGKEVAVAATDPATGRQTIARVPAKRPVEVIDLLRHTAGLTYPEEGSDALHRLYDRPASAFRRDRTLADLVAALASVPLIHQPGEVWEYSWGVDVLARLVEVASGQSFDEFLQSRIFTPLDMTDTGFSVPEAKLGRLVDPPPGGRPALWDVTRPTTLFSGGGGLVSTAPDYLRFCQMLLNGGELDGKRLLKAETVRRMTTDALAPGTRFAGEGGQFVGPLVGTSWGLGFAVRTNADFSLLPGALGSYNWSGYWGTYFWIDPAEKLIGLQMIQVDPETNAGQYRNALRHLTYAALRVAGPADSQAPVMPPAVSAEVLAGYAGTYDFGQSLSAHDKQAPLPAFSGTGLEIAMVEGAPTVRAVFAGGPAAKAGVQVGDVVTEIDGHQVKGLPLGQVLDRIRGPADTEVRLRVARKVKDKPADDKSTDVAPVDFAIIRKPLRPPGARIEVRVTEGQLTIEAIGPWSVLDFEKGKPVAVQAVSSTEFRAGSGDHTRLAFVRDEAGKVTGLILNPGPEEISALKIG